MRPHLVVLLALAASCLAVLPSAQAMIAVLDTGIDAQHPELAGRVERQSFVEPASPGGPLADHDGHGTAAASLAAGVSLGLAPDAPLLDLQVVPPTTALGAADVGPATEAAAQRALDWVLRQDEPPRVVLLSFAGAGLSEEGAATLAAQSARLWEQGVLVVVPAIDGPLGSEARALVVGGTSACGPERADVMAADQSLRAAARSPPLGPGGTTTVSGMGFAAAQAAGAAAQILAEHPDLPVDAVTAILRGTTSPVPDCPVGIIDLEAALARADAWEDPLEHVGDADTPAAGMLPALLMVAAAFWTRRRQ